MKNTQRIKISRSEYASMQEELARLRAESAQLVAEKAALVEAMQEDRDRFRKVIKALIERGSERYKAPVIGEDQLSLFAEQLVAIANAQTPQAEKVASPSKEKIVKPPQFQTF